MIRDVILNTQPFRKIGRFSKLEVTASVENLFHYMQIVNRVDFAIYLFLPHPYPNGLIVMDWSKRRLAMVTLE